MPNSPRPNRQAAWARVRLTPEPVAGCSSPYAAHKARWAGGCGATICPNARRVCTARGTVPADIVFTGEAPGASENVLGLPFVGPAGKLLDRIVAQALGPLQEVRAAEGKTPLTWCFTNLVGCLPADERGRKTGEPEPEDVDACRPRLEEFLALARPRLVVAVGKLAGEYLAPGYTFSVKLPEPRPPVLNVLHPAYILRQSYVQQGLLAQRCEVAIRNAAEDLD